MSWFYKKVQPLDYKPLDEDPIAYGTGDLILFSGSNWLDKTIRLCSRSGYSHVGIVLKNCTDIDPKLTGLYFIESTLAIAPDAEDGTPKFGVTIHKLDEVLSYHAKAGDKAYLRKLKGFTTANQGKISAAYDKVKAIPYDVKISNWIRAKEVADEKSIEEFLATHRVPKDELQETRSMWCSEFVGYFLCEIGVLSPETPWTLLAPKHFSQRNEDLIFLPGYGLGEERKI